VDLLAAQAIGNTDYGLILRARGQALKARAYLKRGNNLKTYLNSEWWDPKAGLYHHYIRYNGEWLDDRQMMSFLLRWNIVPASRAASVIGHLLDVVPTTGVEMNTYYPLEVYRYGKADDAYKLLIRLVAPDLARREYPEVSFAAIETYAMGLMGIEVDAATRTITTRSRLTNETRWAELEKMPVFDGTITVRHEGQKLSELTNHTGQTINWRVGSLSGKPRMYQVKPGEMATCIHVK
jgi:hypothetical protein